MADGTLSWRPTASLETLHRRSELVNRTRRFFQERRVLEVDIPVLQGGCNLDPGIQPLRVETPDGPRFLPTSPEHPLKRLVAAGAGSVWSLGPAFRSGELGQRHGPEFRMLEWYRPGWDDWRLLREVLDLFHSLTGLGITHEVVGYRKAFVTHVGLDPATASDVDVANALGDDRQAVMDSTGTLDRLAALDLLMGTRVEPHLGRGHWTVICDYPPHVAAQARLRMDDDDLPAAARFEIYRDGLELANGYWELTDATELNQRLSEQLRAKEDGRLVRDHRFEAAMAAGLGDCAGVAVGFDRVMMLALGLPTVAATQAFAWGDA